MPVYRVTGVLHGQNKQFRHTAESEDRAKRDFFWQFGDELKNLKIIPHPDEHASASIGKLADSLPDVKRDKAAKNAGAN